MSSHKIWLIKIPNTGYHSTSKSVQRITLVPKNPKKYKKKAKIDHRIFFGGGNMVFDKKCPFHIVLEWIGRGKIQRQTNIATYGRIDQRKYNAVQSAPISSIIHLGKGTIKKSNY